MQSSKPRRSSWTHWVYSVQIHWCPGHELSTHSFGLIVLDVCYRTGLRRNCALEIAGETTEARRCCKGLLFWASSLHLVSSQPARVTLLSSHPEFSVCVCVCAVYSPLFWAASRPALALTRPPIRCVSRTFCPSLKLPGREAARFRLVPRLRMHEPIPHLPIRFHGVVLN